MTYIVARYLLKGAINTFIVQPAISATISMIPQSTLVHYSLLGQNITYSSRDLVKFGLEKLYDKFIGEKLDFIIKKKTASIFQIIPANDLAARFFKEYTDVDELIVDLDVVDEYLDLLFEEDMAEINGIEDEIFEGYEALFQINHDLDIVFEKCPNSSLTSTIKEKELIDAVMEKNMKLVEHSTRKLQLKQAAKDSEVSTIFQDLPGIKYQPTTEDKEIDAIIQKLSAPTKKSRTRKRLGN